MVDLKKKLSNDATLTKLGDIYQYLIVLEECLKMEEDDVIFVETFGDVTKVSKNQAYQKEVKHHIGNKILRDRDDDFWNTLNNWVKNYESLKNFNKFILHTTATPKKDSVFDKWSILTPQERFDSLYNIGVEKKKREKSFRELYDEVFKENKNTIVEVVSKIEINHSQNGIAEQKKSLKTYLKTIPDKNFDGIIEAILGHIIIHPIDEPHSWDIGYNNFTKYCESLGAKYSNEYKQPMNTSYLRHSAPNPTDYYENKFVIEIKNIQYNEEISDAINNYWRTNSTVATYYNDDPCYLNDIQNYKFNLTDKLRDTKKPKNRACKKCSSIEEQIDIAQDMYNEVMAWDAIPFGSIDPNQPFFQKGIIHNIVEDDNFKWRLGED